MSAPHGSRHGKVTVPFSEVERCRDMHEYQGMGYKRIARETGYNLETIKNWLKYQSRCYG